MSAIWYLIVRRWKLSPWAVTDYLLGTTLEDGTVISPKYIGERRLMEVAVATLATDRALLLLGVPGTAKSWVSEHLTAAITGDSTLLIQGTSGIGEESMRYNWNYAQLLAKGPSMDALVPSPMMHAMRDGKLCRIEELTRIPSDVQDTLITILSEKILPIPELSEEVQATAGFNVIATANSRDRGANELSSDWPCLQNRQHWKKFVVWSRSFANCDQGQQRMARPGSSLRVVPCPLLRQFLS